MKKKIAAVIGSLGAVLAVVAMTNFGIGFISATAADGATAESAAAAPLLVETVIDHHDAQPSATAAPAATVPAVGYDLVPYLMNPTVGDVPRGLADHENAIVWVQTQTLARECMLAQGLDYNYGAYWLTTEKEAWISTLSPTEKPAVWAALYGDPDNGGATYRWDKAGCWGAAVHAMGNDNAH